LNSSIKDFNTEYIDCLSFSKFYHLINDKIIHFQS